MKNNDLETFTFLNSSEFESWLSQNHKKSNGVWVKFSKKNSPIQTITYDQALDEALCYGWIDSQVKRFDENFYLQKFTPRKENSIWSKRNTEHVARLISQKRMKPSGLKEVKKARENGRWEQAYNSSADSTMPEDFLEKLHKNKKAKVFFDTLNKANLYAISWRLQTAKKEETRYSRIEKIISMLEKGEKFH